MSIDYGPWQVVMTALVDRSGDVSPERLTGTDLAQLWEETAPYFARSRENILLMRDIEAGREVVPFPSTFDDEAADALTPLLPHRQYLPLKLTATLATKRPDIIRLPQGIGPRARKQAEDYQAWINEIMQAVVEWKKLVGRGTQDGEYAVITLPTRAFWLDVPDFLDSKTGKPQRRYHRDSRGRAYDEPGYSGRYAISQTRKAYREEYQDFLSRRLPFRVRVISGTNCLPIIGPGDRLEGLLVRTLYQRQTLIKRKYRWGMNLGTALLTPQEASSRLYGQGDLVYLYEYFGLDQRDLPYISYSVGGLETWYATSSDPAPAVIDLFEEYGLSRLPVSYAYGMHFESDNVDEKAVPFMLPLASMILNVEANLGSASVYARRMAFPAYVESPNPNSNAELLPEAEDTQVLELPSGGGIIRTQGTVQPLQPGTMGTDVRWLTQVQMATLQDQAPSEANYGGQGAQSGHQLSLSREYLEIANSMILDEAKEAYRYAAEIITELAACFAKRDKVNIPVYRNIESAPNADGVVIESRQLLEFNPDWLGGVYDVKAEFPKGSANIAEIQQAADLADRGYNTFEDVREKMGDRSPMATRAKIFADQYYKSEQGIAEVAALAARMRGEQEQADRIELQSGSRVTQSGFPVAALDPEAVASAQELAAMGVAPEDIAMARQLAQDEQAAQQGVAPGAVAGAEAAAPALTPNEPPPHLPGTKMANIPASSLGGIVAGATESAARMHDAQAQLQMG